MVHMHFAYSLAYILRYSSRKGIDCEIFNIRSSIIASSRNELVRLAKIAHASHILFLDSDMTFPENTLERLLKHKKDIIGAAYVERREGMTLNYVPFQDNQLTAPVKGDEQWKILTEAKEPFKVQSIGTGCLLINIKIFTDNNSDSLVGLGVPWFDTGYDPKNRKIWGEDYMFCHRAQLAAFNIWIDPWLSRQIGHIGQMIHYVDKPSRSY